MNSVQRQRRLELLQPQQEVVIEEVVEVIEEVVEKNTVPELEVEETTTEESEETTTEESEDKE